MIPRSHIPDLRYWLFLFALSIVIRGTAEQQSIAVAGNNFEQEEKATGKVDSLKAHYQKAIDVHAAAGDFRKAVIKQEQLMLLSDSLRELEKQRTITYFQEEFEMELAKDEIALANALNDSQEAMIRQQDLQRYIYLAGGVSILLLVLGMLSRLSYMRRTRLELETQSRKILAEKTRAEESEKVREEFLARMSHEIRSPMNAIVGMTNILRKNKCYPHQHRYLDAIGQSSESLLVILNDILDLSKIEDGTIQIDQVPFRPLEELMKLREILKYKAEEKGLALRCQLDENIPEVLIGDPVRLTQVLINLTGNAIKFTEKGNVFVSISLKEKQGDRVVLETRVEDTGIGISADRLDQVFESFTQAESSITRQYGGTGLGLTISRELIELQNGRITVESEPGKGSVFTFELPYDIGSVEAVKAELHTPGNIQLSHLKVLLVEDNQFNIMVATDALNEIIKDAEITLAGNGREAIQMVQEKDFDVVLMDIEMEEMDGYEAAREIRQLGSPASSVPIIAFTANAIKEEIERCFAAGMDDHISKPFDPEDLKRKIEKLIFKGTS